MSPLQAVAVLLYSVSLTVTGTFWFMTTGQDDTAAGPGPPTGTTTIVTAQFPYGNQIDGVNQPGPLPVDSQDKAAVDAAKVTAKAAAVKKDWQNDLQAQLDRPPRQRMTLERLIPILGAAGIALVGIIAAAVDKILRMKAAHSPISNQNLNIERNAAMVAQTTELGEIKKTLQQQMEKNDAQNEAFRDQMEQQRDLTESQTTSLLALVDRLTAENARYAAAAANKNSVLDTKTVPILSSEESPTKE